MTPMTKEQLTEKRTTLGYSKRALAKALDRNRSTIIRWEDGTTPIPDWLYYVMSNLKPFNKAPAKKMVKVK